MSFGLLFVQCPGMVTFPFSLIVYDMVGLETQSLLDTRASVPAECPAWLKHGSSVGVAHSVAGFGSAVRAAADG